MSAAENKAVFLSYASQDAEAARRICEALRAAGVEVWFDQSELVGGDAWDAKIRGQIAGCALFVPVISANTQARLEGYFRIEWKLAAQRTHAMAEEKTFLLPVVIDATRDAEAKVPGEFKAVQWTRLAGGEASAAFVGRVKKLLGGAVMDVGPVVDRAPGHRPGLQPTHAPSRAWLVPTIIGLVASAALAIWQPWREKEKPVSNFMSPAHATATELVARAWAQLNDPALARSHLEVAGELCQRATALDPDCAEAWAAWSQVDTWFVYHAFDETTKRREQASAKAARALRTAPQGFEPRLAQACYVVRAVSPLPSDFAVDAEKTLRALLVERPEEPRVLFTLGILLRHLERVDESAQVFDRMAKQTAFAATAWSEKAYVYYLAARPRFADAVEPNDRSLAVQPFWGNLALKAVLAFYWKGDLDAAKTAIEGIPAAQFTEGIIPFAAWKVYARRRDSAGMLRVLAALPNDWLIAKPYLVPKAYLSGIAHATAGNGAAADAQWQVALQQVEQRLAEQPNDFWLLEIKAEILARRGETAAARKTFELARQLGGDARSLERLSHAEAVLVGDADAAFAVLERGLQSGTRDYTAANLRLDPDLDRFRNDPRFAALLTRAEADPRLAPQPATRAAQTLSVAANPPDPKSLAVLAFRQLSADPENEYLCEAISDELCNVLGRVPGLKVAASASAFSFKGKRVRPSEMAAQLGVAYLVDGTVQKIGNRVRVTATLIKAVDESPVWRSGTLDHELKDMFSVQDQVVGAIAKNLQLQLGATPRAAKAINPEAYALYQAGRQRWNQRNEGAFAQAEDAFSRAVKLDPQFALGYAGLADVWLLRGNWRIELGEPIGELFGKAEAFARRALELEPDRPDAYATLGNLHMFKGEMIESQRAFERALAINDNYATAHHWYALSLAYRSGRLDLALPHILRATELDPLSPVIVDAAIRLCWDAGKYAEVERLAQRRTLVLNNAEAEAASVVDGLIWRARLHLGRSEEALASARAAVAAGNIASAIVVDSLIALVEAHHADEAEKGLGPLLQRNLPGNAVAPVFAALGRHDDALGAAVDAPAFGIFRQKLFYDSVWDPLREDPRFRELLVKLGWSEDYKTARETLSRMRRAGEGNK